MSNLKKLYSKAASESEECPFDTYNGISLGRGYSSILPSNFFSNSGNLNLDSNALSVLITIIIHSDKDGIAWPGESRIAILSGLHIDSAREATEKLIKAGICLLEPNKKIRIAKMPSRNSKNGFAFFQNIVFRGLWSVLSPAAKKLFLYYCWKSKPFSNRNDEFNRTSIEEEKKSKEDSGRRMVPLEDLCPATIEETLGMSDSTRRDAKRLLDEVGLTYRLPGLDGVVIENTVNRVYPSVLKRVAHAKRTASKVTGGTLRSARAGKVRQAPMTDEA